jgi:hypothetical protein
MKKAQATTRLKTAWRGLVSLGALVVLCIPFFTAFDNPAGTNPRYGIGLSVNGTYVFDAKPQSYPAIIPLTVTVTNTGNRPTGALTAALSGSHAGSFTLTGSAITDIPVEGSRTFTVGPNHGLTEGVYTATVTVTGGNGINVGFAISFTVNPQPVHGIILSVSETHAFDAQTQGYTPVAPLTVTVTNIGTQPTGMLTVSLSGGGEAGFALTGSPITDIAAGGNASFTVCPKHGLAVETYTATITVSGDNDISAGFTVSFTVNTARILTSIEAVRAAIDAAAGDTNDGSTAEKAVSLVVQIDLEDTADYGSNWQKLLEAIAAQDKFVGLDLSLCSMSGTTFYANISVADTPRTSVPLTLPIVSLTMPAVAQTIGLGAFYGCTSLQTVTASAVETIDVGAFADCTGLISVNLPASLISIGTNAFAGCVNLTAIIVDGANPNYSGENGMLLDKAGSTLIAYPGAKGAVTLPNITVIGEYAFYGCTGLQTVTMNAVKTISVDAFRDCTSLQTVTMNAMETIGEGIFSGCASLQTVTMNAVKTIGRWAFVDCTGLQTVTIPAAQTIGQDAFRDCTSLQTVTMNAVKTIDRWAFYDCTSLQTVTMNAVETIEDAFNGCTSLTSVYLPASLISIDGTFYRCVNLAAITVDGANPNYSGENGMLLDKAGTTLIAYPGAKGAVTLTNITTIGEWAFSECTGLTSVTANAAQTIGYNAFAYSTDLQTVTLNTAETIDGNAFFGCTGLQTVTVPNVETIGYSTFGFTGPQALTITMGATPPSVRSDVFDNVTAAKNVTVRVPSANTSAYGTDWQGSFKGGNTNINLTIEGY